GRSHEGVGWGRHQGEIRPPEAEPFLFKMHDGEVELVEVPSGIHIIRLVHREHAGKKPFSDETVQNQIRDKLRNEMGNREIKRILAELKRRAVIEIANTE